MPLFEEKLISPFSIRYSQERIRPTFQDGRALDLAISQIEVVPSNSGIIDSQYSTLLRAPFPPIEIIRWQPRRSEDGSPSSRGVHILEPRWITFDNRRLNCLQKAAAAQWPKSCAAVVRVLDDMPVEKSAIRKMEHASAGLAVNVGRLHDENPSVWDWMAETRGCGDTQAVVEALELVQADAQASYPDDLCDAPSDAIPGASRPPGLSPPCTASQLLDLVARHERNGKAEIAIHDSSGSSGQEDDPPTAKSVTADQLLSEWLRPKVEPAMASPAHVEPPPPAWSATAGLLSPLASPWGESLATPAAPLTCPWQPSLWQSPYSTPSLGLSASAHQQQWSLPVASSVPSPPGLLPLPVPPGPLPRNVPAFPYPAAAASVPPPERVPTICSSTEFERGLAASASEAGRRKVSELFALAASEGTEPECHSPQSAGEDLLSLLKNPASPQHEGNGRSIDIHSLLSPQMSAASSPTSSSSPHTLVMMIRCNKADRGSPKDTHANGNQAGRELLGLLKPAVVQRDLFTPKACSDVRNHIASGIWDALGQAPKGVTF